MAILNIDHHLHGNIDHHLHGNIDYHLYDIDHHLHGNIDHHLYGNFEHVVITNNYYVTDKTTLINTGQLLSY